MNQDYYLEKTITLIIQHGIENDPFQCLKDNFKVIEAQNGEFILLNRKINKKLEKNYCVDLKQI